MTEGDLERRGDSCMASGQLEEAANAYRKAISTQPLNPALYAKLGVVSQRMGNYAAAIQAYIQALDLGLTTVSIYKGLASSAAKSTGPVGALPWLTKALELSPDDGELYIAQGSALNALSRHEEAILSFERALIIDALKTDALVGLAAGYAAIKKSEDAKANLKRALSINPQHREAHLGLIQLHIRDNELPEAIPHIEMIRSFKQETPDLDMSLAVSYAVADRYAEARGICLKILQSQSSSLAAVSQALAMLNYDPELSQADLNKLHRDAAVRFLPPATSKNTRKAEASAKIRIGYISGDFYQHVCASFLYPLIKAHDQAQYDVFCYANNRTDDSITVEFRKICKNWRNIRQLSDDEVIKQIVDDGIDVLVDCSGHTTDNRLTVIARRPAKVIVSFLGYVNSTGIAEIDYRFTDLVAHPYGDIDETTAPERLVRLPNSFHTYVTAIAAPQPNASDFKPGRNIIFGCFHNWLKINPTVRTLWADILKEVPGSRLVLKDKYLQSSRLVDSIREEFVRSGISADRVEFRPRNKSLFEHYQEYNSVDIALDAFPYNGATTTCDAFWMGVPVVALLGDRYNGRITASILTRIGLTDLIATDREDYVRIAAGLAANTARLQYLRQNLRSMFEKSPLGNPELVVRDIEKFYTAAVRGSQVPFIS